MGVQDVQYQPVPEEAPVEAKVATDNTEPVMGDPVPMSVPVDAVTVETIEVANPAVGHFWPACLGTFFCHVLGLGMTLVCCPSSYGKAGAATGFAFSALKLSCVALMGAMVVAHYHIPHAFFPDELQTREACVSFKGVWMQDNHCACPPLFLRQIQENTHRVVCVDSQRFWIKVSILASLTFYLFSMVARYYLRHGSPTLQVEVVTRGAQPVQATPAQVIVINEKTMD